MSVEYRHLTWITLKHTVPIRKLVQEVNAIDNVFCKNRETPLMIGSVKSNLGHAESASGPTEIIKVKVIYITCLFYLKFYFIFISNTNKKIILLQNCSISLYCT